MSLGAAERLVELGSDHWGGGVGGGGCNNGKPVSMQYLILINNQWNTLIPTWYFPDLIGEGVIGSQHSKQSGHPVGQQASKQTQRTPCQTQGHPQAIQWLTAVSTLFQNYLNIT